MPGDDRGPRPRADAPDQDEHGEAAARSATRRRSTPSARSTPTSRRATTTSPRRIGAAMIGWYGTAMLCYVTPKEHLGLPEPRRRQGRRHRLQDRRPRRRPRQGPPGARRTARRRPLPRPLRVPLGGPVQPRARPGDGPRVPRRDPAEGRVQDRALLLHVRPEVLLDEDHPGHPRRGAGDGRRTSAPRWRAWRRSRRSSGGRREALRGGGGVKNLSQGEGSSARQRIRRPGHRGADVSSRLPERNATWQGAGKRRQADR